MFKPNTKHLQPALISSISQLPKKQLDILKRSWARTFYEEVFCRIDEEIFSVLYSDEPSRPNVAINVLVGLDILKAGRGWNDEELIEHFMFNLQVRYALGYDQLGDGDFAIRTLYYFRERLSKHYVKTGNNLLDEVFKFITDTQIEDLNINTEEQRMDSTQITSNIIEGSRLRLLVEAIQRTHRILSEEDQGALAELYVPYLKGSSDHYTYRVKGKNANKKHLQKIGETIFKLLAELEENYAEEKSYQVLKRIFSEHFNPIENDISLKENKELSS
ncbi:MAG: transposase, partial [Candidatus Thermoplasmatota archaeon]|nr:transposase [Candidatus Thermoplasmatota archaeon]